MSKKYLIALFCMFLIVMFPVCFAATYEGAGESLIIEVKEQQPRIIRQALIEDQNAPIILVLGAIRSTPFLTLPKIEDVSVRVIRTKDMKNLIDQNLTIQGTSDETLNYLVGKPQFYESKFPTLDNLGFLKLYLKKIPQGQKIPEQIDIDLEAKIKYEAEQTGTFLGGGSTPESLPEETEEQMKANRDKRVILGGRAYLRAKSITNERATIYVYDAEMKDYHSTGSLEEGAVSRSVSIPGETGEGKNIRIRVNDISGGEQVVLNISGKKEEYPEGGEISDNWKIDYVNFNQNYIRLANPNFKINIYLAKVTGFSKIKDLIRIGDRCEGNNFRVYEGSRIPGLEDIKYNKIDCDEFRSALEDLETIGVTELIEFKGSKEKPAAIIKTEKTPEKRYYEDDLIGDTECRCKISSVRDDKVNIKIEADISQTSIVRKCGDKTYVSINLGDTASYCGDLITLRNIETKKRVSVSVLPGTGKGESVSYFSIHLPIEKRAIQYTPTELAAKLNKTYAQIESLNKTITSLQTLVEGWTKICLAVAALFVVTSFFKGFSGREAETKKEGKEKAEEGWKEFELAPPAPKEGEQVTNIDNLNLQYYDCEKGWLKIPDAELKGLTTSGEYVRTNTGGVAKLQPGVRLKGKENGKDQYYRVGKDGTLTKIDKQNGNFLGGDRTNRDQIKISKDYDTIAIPLQNCRMLPYSSTTGSAPCECWKHTYGDALYLVYSNDDPNTILVAWGGEDGAYYLFTEGKAQLDRVIMTIPANSKEGEQLLKEFARIKESSQRGDTKITVSNQKFDLNPKGSMKSSTKDKTDCETVFSPGQCKILFNACDPVMCPPSRCDFGGKYQVPNVINSGLIGSLLLCLPNIKEGVIMPICLTGLLNAFRKIQVNLQAYANCLQEALINDRTVGICDRLWSIFICQIVWENVMTLLGLTGGLTGGLINKASGKGGGEYLSGVREGVASARKSIDYFTNSYAQTVFASYKGRSMKELGDTICKSAVNGKFPSLGDITNEVTKAQNPPQFTAYVEEQTYSSIAQLSEYKVYFNIYSGSQDVTWKVYLQKAGKTYSVDSGTLGPTEFVDRSPDFTAEPGFKEVCVVINGQPKCGFGKLVSTSFGMTAVHDWILKEELARNIETQEQCLKDSTGYVPEAQVEKVCSAINPGSGKGAEEEKMWTKVGTCGKTKQEVSLGHCWMKTGELAKENPVLYKETLEDMCANQKGKVCELGQICDGSKATTPVSTGYQNVECCFGSCVADEEKFGVKKEAVEKIASTDELYQKMYKEGYRVCSELGSTDPFEDTEGIYGWTTREIKMEKESEDSEERAKFYYFKGLMYLLCENCEKAREDFLKISREFDTTRIYREKACGANDIGGIAETAKCPCKEERVEEKEKVGVPEKEEDHLQLTRLIIMTPSGEEQKTNIDETTKKIELATGGEYKIKELSFNKQIRNCLFSFGTLPLKEGIAKGTYCEFTKENEFSTLGIDDETMIHIVSENKNDPDDIYTKLFNVEILEKSVKEGAILCRTYDGKYYFCIATGGERCSDYYYKGDPAKKQKARFIRELKGYSQEACQAETECIQQKQQTFVECSADKTGYVKETI